MKLPEAGPVHGELADTEHGEADLPREAAQLYRRLRILAGLLRDAPSGEGPRLLWRDPDGKVQTRTLVGTLTIGRSSECDVVLIDPRVSRRHCRVWHVAAECWIEDSDSTTGTRINEFQITQLLLRDGDVIGIGGATLVYVTAK